MIITKKVKLKTKGINRKYYTNFGYETSNEYIIVDIEHLIKGSSEIVIVECDFCEKIIETTYNKYNQSVSVGNKYACSTICAKRKARLSNLEKYGVENVSQLDIIKKKKEETSLKNWGVSHPLSCVEVKNNMKLNNLEKWGVENISQLESVKRKKEETSLKNWGVENPSKSNKIKNKIKKTFLEKWGVDNYAKTNDYKEKSKLTSLEKWGVDNYTKTNDYKEKSKLTSLEKWGVEYYSKTDEFKDKIKQTNLEKWGVEWTLQNKEIREKIKLTNLEKWGSDNKMKSDIYRINKFKISSDPNYIRYLNDSKSLFRCENGHDFEIHSQNYHTRKENNINLCTICNPIGDSRSIKEKELYEFIFSVYDGEIIQSYRDLMEIDIYLPTLKLGFEFNGLYWHSDKFVEKNYHLDKLNHFKEKDIRIVHVWEDDWTFKCDIIKSQIINLIGFTKNKIFARKCEVKEINTSDVRIFLNENHIQGYVNSVKKIGLYFENELVSVMTFDVFEGRKKMEIGGWNLSRFCNKKKFNVVGGASKLLNYFIKKYKPVRIISYADRDWSFGNLYYKLGFNLVSESNPDYKYLYNKKRTHKSKFRKSRIKTNLTESEQMKINGINKVWDCGKIKFELKKFI